MTTATIIVGATALVIENLPSMIESAARIQKLLREQGIESRIVEVNQQAAAAADSVLREIREYRAKPDAVAEGPNAPAAR